VSDPLSGLEHDLAPEHLSGRMETVELSIDAGEEAMTLAYLALYDRLAARASDELGAGAEPRLRALRSRIASLEGALRFELWESITEIEALDRVERIAARESHLKRGWLVPRLRDEIALYRRRIEALETALGRT
jgi:hypothetical protein